MYCIVLLIQIFIINKCVFSYPVSNYKISYVSLCNTGNYPYLTTYPRSITPVAYYNRYINSYTDGRPFMLYDEMAYYGRRRYPTGNVYTYSRSFPVYSSSFTPYLVVQPKLSDVTGLSPVVYTSSPISTSPSLTLSTKLVALPVKPGQDGIYKINLDKESNVDIIYEPTETDKLNDKTDNKANNEKHSKTTDKITAKARDDSVAETSSTTEHNIEHESTKPDKEKVSNSNRHDAKKITEPESGIHEEDNDPESTSKANAVTDVNADGKTYSANESSATNGPNTSDRESTTETDSKPISGKVIFKGMVPAKGRVKIFRKFS